MKKVVLALVAVLSIAGLVMAGADFRQRWEDDDRGLQPGGLLGFAIPNNPLPGQDTPPCPEEVSGDPVVAVRGGCWVRVELWLRDCSSVGYTHEDGCYVPARTRQARVPPE
ncbi:hypothetical protein LZ198_00215 [Myxococcus sp. K15C18031901]|uniref:hypothetical protein n=1 Tax=Myxococcus dinghuensis TaxID=2906761 RepID=UPI0020A7B625|nr:hypothetical protein [Myxococcus dinghuensis]MCP3097287.1 hypothetical protein [Myxococcus dinghuensis]